MLNIMIRDIIYNFEFESIPFSNIPDSRERVYLIDPFADFSKLGGDQRPVGFMTEFTFPI